jgi:cytochrome c oxidase subunit 3
MTSSTLATPHKINRPNLVAVGTIVWLSSELMFFAALFAMYFTTRAVQGPTIWSESTAILNIPFAALNTTVLVLSSVTCQFGVFAAERFQAKRTGSLINFKSWGMREWFSLTFLMGAFFISGQIYEYASLVTEGVTLSSDAYGSVFYMATGFHGFHVFVGTIFLTVCAIRLNNYHFTVEHHFGFEAAAWYWHFVDVVWLFLFVSIYWW